MAEKRKFYEKQTPYNTMRASLRSNSFVSQANSEACIRSHHFARQSLYSFLSSSLIVVRPLLLRFLRVAVEH